jgi:hypothetical protein
MQTSQDQRANIAQALANAIRSCGLSDAELAKVSGADYFAVRRMRRNGIANWGKNAKVLCSFFKLLPLQIEAGSDPAMAWIEQLVRSAWDGTPEHRQFLEDLLGWAGRYKVTLR